MHCFWIETPLIYNIFDDNQYMAQFMAFGGLFGHRQTLISVVVCPVFRYKLTF